MMNKNIKIAISGAHSQGKTTIVNALRNLPEFKDYKIITGITRDLEQLGVPINEKGTDVTQQFIMAKHYQYAQLQHNCILDRCVLDGLAYTTCFRSKIPSWMWNYFITLFSNLIKRYDYIFYVEPELPLVSDGVRTVDLNFFNQVVNQFNKLITEFELPVIRLSGSIENRIQKIQTIINSTIK